jgi:hypothetical protein
MPSSAREEVAMKGPVRSRAPAAAAAVGSLAVLLANLSGAHAVRPDECEQQRKLYPAVWADVSQEQPLFECASHYAGSLRIKLGAADGSGRALMSLVPLKWFGQTALEDPASGIFRIWLDKEQVARLREIFRHDRAEGGLLLDSRQSRQGSDLPARRRRSARRHAGRRLVLQSGAAHERLRRRCLHVPAGQVKRGKQLPIEEGRLAAELGHVLINSDCSAIR